MKLWLTLAAIAAAAATALVIATREDDARGVPPRPVLHADGEDLQAVVHGSRGPLELLLLPGELDPDRERFHGKIWSEALETGGRWRIARLWVLNHGDDALTLPEDLLAGFRREGEGPWASRAPLSLAADPARLARHLAHRLAAADLEGRREIAPHAMMEFSIALPATPDWTGMTQVVCLPLEGLVLAPRTAAREALADFAASPKGRLDRLLRPTDGNGTVERPRSLAEETEPR
ncbi:MAG: hypothetical protein R3F20_12205 [Planctomycetota bacterium]